LRLCAVFSPSVFDRLQFDGLLVAPDPRLVGLVILLAVLLVLVHAEVGLNWNPLGTFKACAIIKAVVVHRVASYVHIAGDHRINPAAQVLVQVGFRLDAVQ